LPWSSGLTTRPAFNLAWVTVVASPATVDFLINGTKVASKPRADVTADGIVGLRVNHNLNLHVAKLEVTPSK